MGVCDFHLTQKVSHTDSDNYVEIIIMNTSWPCTFITAYYLVHTYITTQTPSVPTKIYKYSGLCKTAFCKLVYFLLLASRVTPSELCPALYIL